MLVRAAAAALALCLLGCTAEPEPRTAAAHDVGSPPSDAELKTGGSGLLVTVRSAVADGRKIRISGVVANHSDQPVDGVRYTVRLMAAGEPPRVVETFHDEAADTFLDPHQERAMRVEIEQSTHASGPGRFEIAADPMRIGGADVPPPAGWK